MARNLFLVCLLVFLAWVRPARADERAQIEIDASPASRACDDATVLRAKIAERLGRDPFTHDSNAPLRVGIAFTRSGRTWKADITLFDAGGKRIGARVLTNEATTCEPLFASVVFTVAVLLDDLSPRQSEPTHSDAPAEPPKEAPTNEPLTIAPVIQVEQPQGPMAVREVHVDATLAGAGALGGAPAPAFGGEIGIGLDVARFRTELSGRAYLPASSDGDVAVRSRLIHARIAPCYGLPVASACAVVALGSMSAEATGAGIAESRTEARFYAASGAGLLSRVFVVRDLFFVRASIDVLFAIARAGFEVGERRVWTVPAIAATTTLGLGVRLP